MPCQLAFCYHWFSVVCYWHAGLLPQNFKLSFVLIYRIILNSVAEKTEGKGSVPSVHSKASKKSATGTLEKEINTPVKEIITE